MRPLAVATCAMALVCCGPQEVQGSLSTIIDLKYDTVDLNYTGGSTDGGIMTNGQVAVRFLQTSGKSENAVLVITENIDGLEVLPGGAVDLTQVPPSGVGQRGVVTRDVENDPRTTFPPLQFGTMELDSTPIPGSGQSVTGSFNVTFALCPDFACGYTAYSSFTARVQ